MTKSIEGKNSKPISEQKAAPSPGDRPPKRGWGRRKQRQTKAKTAASGKLAPLPSSPGPGQAAPGRAIALPPALRSPKLPGFISNLVKMRRFQIVSAVIMGGSLLAGWVLYERQQIINGLPDPAEALTFARRGTLTIKSSDGVILQKLGPSTRDPVEIEKIPEILTQAFVASEDSRFYQHRGVDYQSIARALKANISAGEVVEGGSTITQQLARIAFLDLEQTVNRKLREALLAQRIEQKLTKDQILERYLSLVYLGSGAYGVADAAWIYFGKPLDKLTLGEAATIAGVPPAPSSYSPIENLDIAQQRRDIVLQRMVDAEYITQAQADEVMAQDLVINPKEPKYFDSLSPYFTTHVKKELARYLTQDQIEAGGLTIETSLNLKWQDYAAQMVVDFVENEGYYQRFDQAAFTAIDPRTGAIKVMVGGADFSDSEFNRVTQAQRQPGSTFKTFVYTAAIAAGFSPYRGYKDVPIEVDGYKPKNYGGKHIGNVDMLQAIKSSINTVALRTLLEVGYQPVIKMARGMGIESKMEETYSLSLGAWEMNVLEMTSAYGTLANEGKHVQPHGILKVLNSKGDVILMAAKNLSPRKSSMMAPRQS
ncbi:MAG: penicillin-binding protein [Synechococcales cyanobacterium RM1_1_8]|nr:penicillin-binding protein [Synechococcales cyanobacterium RM1_1_8]